ncbi:MAG: ATP-dependent sacrificial sulfur transferase LarE, partial [Thermodesulfobacteriota bacterium]|nr:ATP-dependent sacrificial sulfur transferase LarE [Thermodesulfobacteriota bacterium]
SSGAEEAESQGDKREYSPKIEDQASGLQEYFSRYDGAIISYSGGVDSALLAYVAHLALGERMLAVIADSPSLSRREWRSAKEFASRFDIPLRTVYTEELKDPDYISNMGNRCYYCKKDLFKKLHELRDQLTGPADNRIVWPIICGTNLDDLNDYRPGMRAAEEASVLAPYVDLGFDKKTIRALASYFDIGIADKPAMPCLASRIAYGEEVTDQRLRQVEEGEDLLYELGLKIFRVRHHGALARIEVPPHDFPVLIENGEHIVKKFRELGFTFVGMDLAGFKSGSLNETLTRQQAI